MPYCKLLKIATSESRGKIELTVASRVKRLYKEQPPKIAILHVQNAVDIKEISHGLEANRSP